MRGQLARFTAIHRQHENAMGVSQALLRDIDLLTDERDRPAIWRLHGRTVRSLVPGQLSLARTIDTREPDPADPLAGFSILPGNHVDNPTVVRCEIRLRGGFQVVDESTRCGRLGMGEAPGMGRGWSAAELRHRPFSTASQSRWCGRSGGNPPANAATRHARTLAGRSQTIPPVDVRSASPGLPTGCGPGKRSRSFWQTIARGSSACMGEETRLGLQDDEHT